MEKPKQRRKRLVLPTKFRMDKRNRSAFSLEAVQTHGILYYAYHNCIGNRTLKAAYLPEQMRWYNVALWAVTALPPIILIFLLFLDWRWAWASPVFQIVITLGIFAPVAKHCIRRGLSNDYAAVGIGSAFSLQPPQLHGPLVRLLWFHNLAAEQGINRLQVKKCIEMVELVGKDSPPSWTSYFRHPLPLLILGIVAYTLNAKILQLLQSAATAELVLAAVGVVAAWILGFGWMLYSWRYSEFQSRWSFLRSLRWLELSMRP